MNENKGKIKSAMTLYSRGFRKNEVTSDSIGKQIN
ncbi:hypothetical protein BH10BAC2_BH10BAC2_02350 [soil metagenome]